MKGIVSCFSLSYSFMAKCHLFFVFVEGVVNMTNSSIYEQLRNCLVTREFAPGQRLSPDTLASRFGTSLSPIREALQQLASEGFVERIQNQGTFVREFTRQQLSDLVEVREVLECHAASVAARRINENELYTLRVHIEQLETAYDQFWKACLENPEGRLEKLEHIAEIDFGFHLSILHAAGNEEVISILHNNHAMVQMFGYRTDPPSAWGSDYEQTLRENCAIHREIHDAIAARKPREARRAMMIHNQRARVNLFGRFDAILSGQTFSNKSPRGEFSPSFRKRINEELKKK